MAMVKKYSRRKINPPVFNVGEGSSRTTPVVLNGTNHSASNSQVQYEHDGEQQDDEEGEEEDEEDDEHDGEQDEEEDDIEDYTSDTSPGLSAGYTDESPETED